jgi:hypothetical protein
MVSLDHNVPVGHVPLSNPVAPPTRINLGAPQAVVAPPSSAAEAAALLDVVERVLRDSDLRAEQAGFSTILRDFDMCVIKRSAN